MINLNDDGPGSLRAAIAAAGPRTVVFRVGGTWHRNDEFVEERGRGDRNELFHLKDDPLEKRDLADQEPERVSQLLGLLSKMADKDR